MAALLSGLLLPAQAGSFYMWGELMSQIKISPSILSADFTRLGEEVRDVLRGGSDYIHVDVMDGIFVPNLSFGLPIVKSLRKAFPDVFLDVHLMIAEPVRFVADFCDAGASLVTIHVESDTPENTTRALDIIRGKGVKSCLSLKPKTPAWAVIPWLDRLDMVLVMTVEPGFGGQGLIMDTLPKIHTLRGMIEERDLSCDIEVDGGVTNDMLSLVTEAGANVIVAGSAIFARPDRAAAVRSLRDTLAKQE